METKLCFSCVEYKPTSCFHKAKKEKDGFQYQCIDCSKKYHAKRYVEKKEKIRTQIEEYRLKNKEKIEQAQTIWKAKNPEKVKLYAKRVKQNNKGKVNFHTAKRRYAKLQRTPHWLTEDDHWMIKEAYDLSALRTKMFGFSWHVDHVIPLQGEKVSGLHVPINLQVIPGTDNDVKGNKFEVSL